MIKSLRCSLGGSEVNTSKAAPATLPLFSARRRAASSIIPVTHRGISKESVVVSGMCACGSCMTLLLLSTSTCAVDKMHPCFAFSDSLIIQQVSGLGSEWSMYCDKVRFGPNIIEINFLDTSFNELGSCHYRVVAYEEKIEKVLI